MLALASLVTTVIGALVPVAIHLIEKPRRHHQACGPADPTDPDGDAETPAKAEGSRIRTLFFAVAAVFFLLAIGAFLAITDPPPPATAEPPTGCIRSATPLDGLPFIEMGAYVRDLEDPYELFMAVNIESTGYDDAVHIPDPDEDGMIRTRIENPNIWADLDVYLVAVRVEYPNDGEAFDSLQEAEHFLQNDAVVNVVDPGDVLDKLTMGENIHRCERHSDDD
jgi:hypothetical protein